MLVEKFKLGEYCWLETKLSANFKLIPKENEEKYLNEFYLKRENSVFDPLLDNNNNDIPPLPDSEELKKIDPYLITLSYYISTRLNRIEDKIDRLLDEKPGNKVLEKKMPYEGECVRLSGTGLIIDSEYELKNSNLIRINLVMPMYPPKIITSLSRVVRVIKDGSHESSKLIKLRYTYILKFVSILEEDQDEIFRYIADKQRESIRNSNK